jgi:hypothetical protein
MVVGVRSESSVADWISLFALFIGALTISAGREWWMKRQVRALREAFESGRLERHHFHALMLFARITTDHDQFFSHRRLEKESGLTRGALRPILRELAESGAIQRSLFGRYRPRPGFVELLRQDPHLAFLRAKEPKAASAPEPANPPRDSRPGLPWFAQALNLGQWPVPRKAVVAAFRARAKEAHPDCGGSAREFVRIQEAKECALESIAADEARGDEEPPLAKGAHETPEQAPGARPARRPEPPSAAEPEATPLRSSSPPAPGPYSDLWHLFETDPDTRTAVYHGLLDAGLRPVKAAERISEFCKAVAQGGAPALQCEAVQDVVNAARSLGLNCVREQAAIPGEPEVDSDSLDPPAACPVSQHHCDLWDLLQRDRNAMTAVRRRLWSTGMAPSLAAERISEFGSVVEAGMATTHDQRLALDDVFGAAEDALAHLGVGTTARKSGPKLQQAIRDSHRVFVDTMRQQVRDGEGDNELLQELVQDFGLEIMRQTLEGGPHAYAAELQPGEELHAAFMDWVFNDPTRGGVEESLRWRRS